MSGSKNCRIFGSWDMAELLSPRQLGYGVGGGAEAAVHAATKFLENWKMVMS